MFVASASGVRALHRFKLPLLVLLLSMLAVSCSSSLTEHQIATSVVGNGRVLPASGSFQEGKVVWIEAVPDAGWQFDGWSGDGSGTDSSLLVTVDRDRQIVAEFSELADSTIVQINSTTEGSGSVDTDSPTYTRGSIAKVTAVPDPGWVFDGWSGGFDSNDPSLSFVVRGDTDLHAKFVSAGTDTQSAPERNVRALGKDGNIIITFKTAEPTVTSVDHGLTKEMSNPPIVAHVASRSHRVVLPGYTAHDMIWFRIHTTDQNGNDSIGPLHSVELPVPGLPVFDLWHGNEQRFGNAGIPQKSINILGDVTDSDGVDQLFASINGGDEMALGIGPDGRRLSSVGDFNVEIATKLLNSGDNEIKLRAIDGAGNANTAVVHVTWNPVENLELPFATDWGSSSETTDYMQVVDGDWEITAAGAHTVVAGYDRILAVGDPTWSDFDATTTVEVHSIDVSGFNPRSISPLVGIAFGWQGHSKRTPTDVSQPLWYFWPTGAFAWYKYEEVGSGFTQLRGNLDSNVDTNRSFDLVTGLEYAIRVQAITEDTGVRYRMKIWNRTAPEPNRWTVETLVADGPASGGLALIAHHVDATFGDLVVSPIG